MWPPTSKGLIILNNAEIISDTSLVKSKTIKLENSGSQFVSYQMYVMTGH